MVSLAGMPATCLAQDDFGDDRMDEPVDLESLIEDSKRSFRHENDVDSLEDDATYIEQTILALQQLGLVLGRLHRMNGPQLSYKETDNCEQHQYSVVETFGLPLTCFVSSSFVIWKAFDTFPCSISGVIFMVAALFIVMIGLERAWGWIECK